MTFFRFSLTVCFAALILLGGPRHVGAQFPQYEMIDRDTGLTIGPLHRRGLIAGSPIPRATVAFDGRRYGVGSIVVNTAERRLYLVIEEARALRYGIGVGREGFTFRGSHPITHKREWPDWRPPEAMLRRQPGLPRFMKGGPDNPLGARALYLGATLYRIHGSNEPETIGQAVSSGCIRMSNEDVIDLYERVRVGTMVHVL